MSGRLALALCLLAAGCASDPAARLAGLESEGLALGFSPVRMGEAPPLAGMLRQRGDDDTLWVVIEGDGRAWLGMREPSPDPTPSDAVGWRLAQTISRDKILYLARPCQYLMAEAAGNCGTDDWTEGRFADKWVRRMDAAIGAALVSAKAHRLVLAGYSGGGPLAALIAQRRDDVDALITLASPLDHLAWSHYHGISPLSGSLNPADAQAKLASLPQLHVVGLRDGVVPPALAAKFVAAYPTGSPAAVLRLDTDHAITQHIDLARLPIPLRTATGHATTTGVRYTYP